MARARLWGSLPGTRKAGAGPFSAALSRSECRGLIAQISGAPAAMPAHAVSGYSRGSVPGASQAWQQGRTTGRGWSASRESLEATPRFSASLSTSRKRGPDPNIRTSQGGRSGRCQSADMARITSRAPDCGSRLCAMPKTKRRLPPSPHGRQGSQLSIPMPGRSIMVFMVLASPSLMRSATWPDPQSTREAARMALPVRFLPSGAFRKKAWARMAVSFLRILRSMRPTGIDSWPTVWIISLECLRCQRQS